MRREDLATTDVPARPRDRLALRLLAEMQSNAAAAHIRAFEGDLDRSILFAVVVSRAGAFAAFDAAGPDPPVIDPPLRDPARTDRPAADPPATDPPASFPPANFPRAITINALAASLSRPFETVRRHVAAMIAAGLCTRTPRGVAVPAEALARPAIAALLRTDHDLLVRLIEDMSGFGLPLPLPRPRVAYDPRAGIAAALDILLAGIEFSAPRYDNWFEMILLGAVQCANDRPLTYDRATSLAFSEGSRLPPDSFRAPVRIAAVARALGVPYSTARRHAEAMLHDGRLVRRRGGLLVADSWLASPAVLEDRRAIAEHTRQILARLAAAGFPFDDPARAYLADRPPPLLFA